MVAGPSRRRPNTPLHFKRTTAASSAKTSTAATSGMYCRATATALLCLFVAALLSCVPSATAVPSLGPDSSDFSSRQQNSTTTANDITQANGTHGRYQPQHQSLFKRLNFIQPPGRTGGALIPVERQSKPFIVTFGGRGDDDDSWLNNSQMMDLDSSKSRDMNNILWIDMTNSGLQDQHMTKFSAVLTPNMTKIIIYGGIASGSSANKSPLRVFDCESWQLKDLEASSGSNSAATKIPPRRSEHTAVILPTGQMYVFGGVVGGNAVNELWRMDAATLRWERVTTSADPTPRRSHTATLIDNGTKMVIIGGSNQNGAQQSLDAVDVFDFTTSKWIKRKMHGTIPKPRSQHIAVAIDSRRIVLHGGSDSKSNSQYFDDMYMIDTGEGKWSYNKLTPDGMPSGRAGHMAAVTTGGYVMMTSGQTGSGKFDESSFLYDPNTNRFVDTIDRSHRLNPPSAPTTTPDPSDIIDPSKPSQPDPTDKPSDNDNNNNNNNNGNSNDNNNNSGNVGNGDSSDHKSNRSTVLIVVIVCVLVVIIVIGLLVLAAYKRRKNRRREDANRRIAQWWATAGNGNVGKDVEYGAGAEGKTPNEVRLNDFAYPTRSGTSPDVIEVAVPGTTAAATAAATAAGSGGGSKAFGGFFSRGKGNTPPTARPRQISYFEPPIKVQSPAVDILRRMSARLSRTLDAFGPSGGNVDASKFSVVPVGYTARTGAAAVEDPSFASGLSTPAELSFESPSTDVRFPDAPPVPLVSTTPGASAVASPVPPASPAPSSLRSDPSIAPHLRAGGLLRVQNEATAANRKSYLREELDDGRLRTFNSHSSNSGSSNGNSNSNSSSNNKSKRGSTGAKQTLRTRPKYESGSFAKPLPTPEAIERRERPLPKPPAPVEVRQHQLQQKRHQRIDSDSSSIHFDLSRNNSDRRPYSAGRYLQQEDSFEDSFDVDSEYSQTPQPQSSHAPQHKQLRVVNRNPDDTDDSMSISSSVRYR
ncbi:hypothetical protein GQ42DRAFT_24816 [Ramicandelaber brevisporus]|nr:hypothetical protein GQ42DRAFT_24816 [Ramicandelaber brevisporus]